MKLIDAQKLANELIEKHLGSGDFGQWKFCFNDSKRAAGLTRYFEQTIELSQYYTRLESVEEVKDTILHEIAHAMTPGHGHGRIWKLTASILGAKPKSTAKTEKPLAEIAQVMKPKYVVVCPKGEILSTYHRKPGANTYKKIKNAYKIGFKEETKGKLQIIPYHMYERMFA